MTKIKKLGNVSPISQRDVGLNLEDIKEMASSSKVHSKDSKESSLDRDMVIKEEGI